MSEATYEGSCHCGVLSFCYTTAKSPDDWSVRACQCRFCRMHDALSTSDPQGTLEFTGNDPSTLQRYRFALMTADFLICRQCGVYLGAVIDTQDGRFGIINTHALRSIPSNVADVGAISYDAEDAAGRISRREERWTPVTKVPW